MDNTTVIFDILNEKPLMRDPLALRVSVIIILVVIFVVAFLGNLASCVVIVSNRSMHTVINLYLLNLAVSDLCMLAWIFVDMRLIWNLTQYPLGEIGCKIHFFVVVFLFSNGVLTVTALAIERYLAVCRPFALRLKGKKRVLITVLFIWLVSGVIATFDVISTGLRSNSKLKVCLHSPSESLKVANGVISLVIYVVPVVTVVAMYSKIACKLNEKEANTGASAVFNGHASKRKATWMLLILTVLMFLCWTPFLVMRMLWVVSNLSMMLAGHREILKAVIYTWIVNCWLSTAVNPLVFSIMSAKFRENLMALVLKKRESCHRKNMTRSGPSVISR